MGKVCEKYALISVVLIFLFINVFIPVFADEQCDKSLVLDKVHKYVNDINDYNISGQVSIQDESFVIISNFIGNTNKRLKISQTISQGNITQINTSVYDGRYQWVESHSSGVVNISKIDLAKVADKAKPFDSGYYIMGSGLMNGEDYPGTLKLILSIYDLTVDCVDNNYHLQGVLKRQAYIDYIKTGRWSKNKLASIDKFADQFQFIKILVNSDGEILSYNFQNGEKSTFSYTIIKSKINGGLLEDAFKISVPENTKVEDITNIVLQTLD